MSGAKHLSTRKGIVPLPAYFPVTTFGTKYPLDDLIRPYLPRLASAVMVSYHYAKQQTQALRIPMLVDSGGFVSLFANARVERAGALGQIILQGDGDPEVIHPGPVLDFQEQAADVAFTLDFPIPPGMDPDAAQERLELTVANARWALENRRRRDLPLFACIQGWDLDSYLACARAYIGASFDGVAIGGLIPRARDVSLILQIVAGVRNLFPELPLHVFGLGNPKLLQKLLSSGADSVDSSSYVKMAADGRLWGSDVRFGKDTAPTTRLHLALCNLAIAAGRPLPLGASGLHFGTPSLQRPVSPKH